MDIQDYTTEELIEEIVARNECYQIGRLLDIDDCGFDCSELKDELEGHGYNVSMDNFFNIEDADDDDLKDELESRGFIVSEDPALDEDYVDIVRRDFERNPTAALNVLQDLLGMQHTTTKEQVIEQPKSVL